MKLKSEQAIVSRRAFFFTAFWWPRISLLGSS
jgi:hypothetical protein